MTDGKFEIDNNEIENKSGLAWDAVTAIILREPQEPA